jgi:hypothetical protein
MQILYTSVLFELIHGTLKTHLYNNHPGFDIVDDTQTTLGFRFVREVVGSERLTALQVEKLNMLMLRWVVTDALPFTVYESESFKDILLFFNSSVALWSRVTARNVLLEVFSSMKKQVKEYLQAVRSKISLTSDMWTSLAGEPYIGLTCHWIDAFWKLHSMVVDIHHLPHPHDAEHITEAITKTLDEFGLSTKILAITHDNAANVVCAAEMLKHHLARSDQIPVQSCRCVAHILNLVVESGLDVIKPTTGKVRCIAKKLSKSSKIAQAFHDYGKTLKEPLRTIPLDVSTRWNSQYLMLEAASQRPKSVELLLEQHWTDFGITIDAAEKGRLKTVQDLLKPFYDVTTNLSGQTYTTMGLASSFLPIWKRDCAMCAHQVPTAA